jgi:hypothetical protein
VLLTAATALCLLTLTGFLGAKGDSPKEKRENIYQGNQVVATGSLGELLLQNSKATWTSEP